jgi:hypothetical protein
MRCFFFNAVIYFYRTLDFSITAKYSMQYINSNKRIAPTSTHRGRLFDATGMHALLVKFYAIVFIILFIFLAAMSTLTSMACYLLST